MAIKWLYIFYCSHYFSAGLDKDMALIVAISQDTVVTYIEEVGYIRWKLKKTLRLDQNEDDVTHAKLILESDIAQGFLYITPTHIYHYAYFRISGEEFKFNITYTRNNSIRPQRSLYERNNIGRDPPR